MSDEATAQSDALDAEGAIEADPPASAYGVPVTNERDQQVLFPDRDNYIATIEALKADGFVSAVDLCGVDNLTRAHRSLPAGVAPERFEVVVSLLAHEPPRRTRVRVQVPESDPTIATLFDLYPGTENLERETWDMFGIVFENHPDPSRILMPPDWQGHPLRKDFAVGTVPVQFKGASAPR